MRFLWLFLCTCSTSWHLQIYLVYYVMECDLIGLCLCYMVINLTRTVLYDYCWKNMKAHCAVAKWLLSMQFNYNAGVVHLIIKLLQFDSQIPPTDTMTSMLLKWQDTNSLMAEEMVGHLKSSIGYQGQVIILSKPNSYHDNGVPPRFEYSKQIDLS